MQSLWILTNYNNYYNRQIKFDNKSEMTSGYLDFLNTSLAANFNPNDGITTSHIIGSTNSYDGKGDYLVVWNDDGIESRWFIIENKRTRAGQYEIALRRDVIADYYNNILEAPMFIEKANPSYRDPAVFNKENMSFNQIKVEETKLWDHTKVPWLVGYCAKGETFSASTPQDFNLPHNEVATYEDIPNYNFTGTFYPGFIVRLVIGQEGTGNDKLFMDFKVNTDGTVEYIQHTVKAVVGGWWYFIPGNSGETWESVAQKIISSFKTLDYNEVRQLFDGMSVVKKNELEEQNNVVYRTIDTDKYYQFITNSSWTEEEEGEETEKRAPQGSGIEVAITNIVGAAGCHTGVYNDNSILLYGPSYSSYSVDIINEVVPYTSVEFSKLEVSDNGAPYAMFCMPYGDIQYGSYDKDERVFYNNKKTCLMLMMDLIKKYGGENATLYDAQILPYCPISAIENNMRQGFLRVEELNDVSIWTPIKDGLNDTILGYLFHCPTTKIHYELPWTITIPDKDLKISNECDMYRLVSPNWNGQFEFSAAKNYGVDYFNIDIELKPYNPYIHVAPNFKGLYGQRENDAIGLICGGDFSMSQISEAFSAYSRQNKNLQDIFDRQIQNLEVSQEAQRIQDITGIATGALGGAAGGAALGSIIPGVGTAIGAGIGAAVGGVASIIGGIADYSINESLRNEAIDYTKDQFGYQLGNIKALPASLTKVSSFNPNNDLYVFLEKYTCTDVEKEALRNKLKYNGYTIGRIGTISEFLKTEPTYIKGQLIRLNIDEDTHFVNIIAEELNKGVFI